LLVVVFGKRRSLFYFPDLKKKSPIAIECN